MQIDVQMLLDGFETPAVFYRENTVRYFNQWAKMLFPSLAAGKPLPEDFDLESSPFVPEAHVTPRGTLYLFRHRVPPVSADQIQMTRELRGCLAELTGATDGLADRLRGWTDGETERLLEISCRSLHRLRRLADHSDLLGQMESGAVGIYREGTLDLAGLCRELERQVAPLAAKAGAQFRVECPGGTMLMLGDESLLQRMLLNLISNSLRAVQGNGEVGLRLEQRGDRAVLTLWDNGPGMEAERLRSAFRPQPRRHRLPKPEDGAAMGLRLVREIAVLHRGLILAENRPGGGVSMTISLPVRKAAGGRLHAPAAWGEDGFSLVLTELADVLPAEVYTSEDLDG